MGWWIYLQANNLTNTFPAYLFNWFYGLIGFSAFIYGIRLAFTKWGGMKSLIGRAILCLSVGLFCQWFGLQIWSYYNLIAKVEVPYPSLADAGYFGLAPFYTLAALYISRASGAKFSLRTSVGKLYAFLIPLPALALAYLLFLKDVGLDPTNPLKMFFDIAYPLGEILPVSIAIFTLTLSNKLLSGTMKGRVLYLVGAFSFQFMTEYVFLIMAGQGLYQNGGVADLLYASSHAVMALGLVYFSSYD